MVIVIRVLDIIGVYDARREYTKASDIVHAGVDSIELLQFDLVLPLLELAGEE